MKDIKSSKPWERKPTPAWDRYATAEAMALKFNKKSGEFTMEDTASLRALRAAAIAEFLAEMIAPKP